MPEFLVPISDEDLLVLQTEIDPLANDEGYGYDLYIKVLTFVNKTFQHFDMN